MVRTRTRTRRRARLVALGAAVALALTGVGGILGLGDPGPGDVPTVPGAPGGGHAGSVPDPYAWDAGREDEFVRRAADGTSHPLYRLSPGGVIASAARTARWRPQIEAAAEQAGVDPDTLEGLVFLESAGREDAMTPGGIEGAVGLTQILAETGSNLLEMHVDTARSARDTRRIDRALRRGKEGKAAAAARGPRPGRRALRRREVAAGHGPLPEARARALRPRGPRVRQLPHGHRQPRERARRVRRRRRRQLRARVLRQHAGPPHRRLPQALGLRRRLAQLPVEGLRGAGHHAPVPGRPRASSSASTPCRRPRTPPRRCSTPTAR